VADNLASGAAIPFADSGSINFFPACLIGLAGIDKFLPQDPMRPRLPVIMMR